MLKPRTKSNVAIIINIAPRISGSRFIVPTPGQPYLCSLMLAELIMPLCSGNITMSTASLLKTHMQMYLTIYNIMSAIAATAMGPIVFASSHGCDSCKTRVTAKLDRLRQRCNCKMKFLEHHSHIHQISK